MKMIKRHDFSAIITHWLVALSTFTLFFTGFVQLPVAKRYFISTLPGLSWSADYSFTLKLHYLAAVVLTFALFFHLASKIITRDFDLWPRRGDIRESYLIIKSLITKKPEPPSDKYLAEQRLAYAYMAFNFLIIVLTGMIKVYKNLPGISLNPKLVWLATTLHNISSFLLGLGIFAHLLAFILFRENRNLIPSMFTGKVSLEYAKHRHPLWLKRIKNNDNDQQERPQTFKQQIFDEG
ncbi:formate dehydrogenase subunit gamma [Carboxydothermus ferrireducens]|uniref:Formate dehydrogenase gamma subunit n=1 Tax=Carboxydothermus ferrireducens DSM 11255 TaxID=1119529 RepID=A0ABX2R8I3_9THEO|nr:cytochrome b/b6 domain-containing protein [Carboxydothermus ferrireducens]NYE57484.1 formate dehydrogenase gamma subunit [Carboxydothermus ferrireducens DSM 11255]